MIPDPPNDAAAAPRCAGEPQDGGPGPDPGGAATIQDGLALLLAEGLPARPVENFAELHAHLTERLAAAQRAWQEREDAVLRRAEQLVGELQRRAVEAQEQLATLEALRAEFARLGDVGAEGAAEIDQTARRLHRYQDELSRLLRLPALREAQARRREQVAAQQRVAAGGLHPDGGRAETDAAIDAVLALVPESDPGWAEPLLERFEADARTLRRLDQLAAVQRFWRQLARAYEALAPERAGAARERARRLEQEHAEREARARASAEATALARQVRAMAGDLARLGPEERTVRLHIWLGRLRKFQDECDLDEAARGELYSAFGALNATRKALDLRGSVEPLNRHYMADWDRYVEAWEERLDDAIRRDREDREEDERAERARLERERLSAQERALADARVTAATAMLRELASTAQTGTGASPEDAEEAREILLAGVENGGCQNEAFLEAAAAFAALAQGGAFRRLRRSLAKRGVDVDEASGAAEPARTAGPEAELLARLAPRWAGRTLALVGGLPRDEIRERLRLGLGLREARWYEHYRDHDDLPGAEAAIRAGGVDAVLLLIRFGSHAMNQLRETCRTAGVPVRLVQRGCGVVALLRALDGWMVPGAGIEPATP